MTDNPALPIAVRVDVRKDGRLWIGDLVWSDGKRWPAWQVHKTFSALTASARCTFAGEIVRTREKDS